MITIEDILDKYYGLKGSFKKLAGEVDENYCIETSESKFLLKVSHDLHELDNIKMQIDICKHLHSRSFPLSLPRSIASLKGNDLEITEEGKIIRLQTWVEGRMVDDFNPKNTSLLHSWGKTVGLLSRYLQDFDHPAAHKSYKWNPSECLEMRQFEKHISNTNHREIAIHFWDCFETQVLAILPQLRKSINHNDAHELNLVGEYQGIDAKVSGVIDFGDSLYCETINELAIACAYACMDLADPLSAACTMLTAYHEVFPLQDLELKVLYYLIAARLLITVTNAARARDEQPDHSYLQISEKQAWSLLEKWRTINPSFAYYRFRQACGLVACPQSEKLATLINSNRIKFHKLVDTSLLEQACPINLSMTGDVIQSQQQLEDVSLFEKQIQKYFIDQETDLAYGGYLEVRPLYITDAYQSIGNQGARWRTTHLGLDLWTAKESKVYAPMAGEVYSIHDNEGNRDYGPTLILKHQIEDLVFYTLYGHLSRASLDHVKTGDDVKAGEWIASIGGAPENGNWPPHLHFQIIMDMLGHEHDFPGVAYPEEIETWKSICPDPSLFFPTFKVNRTDPILSDILSNRKKSLGYGMSISYDKPLHIVRGAGAYLYDHTGRRYLDTVNNVAHVGHQHPRIVKALQRQSSILNTNTRYLHQNIVQYADALLDTLPKELCVVHFVNSGSEANELALRMAYAYTKSREVIAVDVGYHGNTGACIDVSSYKFDQKGGNGKPNSTHILPLPDSYRGIHRGTESVQYAVYINDIIQQITSTKQKVGAFICESILSCGGQIPLPKNYLKYIYHAIRNEGGVCIADEVQVGFGRVGSHFWGFELQDVVPDIVTMGKPMGNGHPIAAVVCTHEIATAFNNGMEYFNTFGGNPVSCAVGQEVLQIVQDEGLQNHAMHMGQYIKEGLMLLQTTYPVIGDIRGHGLFLGMELVDDPYTKAPAADKAHYLINRMSTLGVLMSSDGPDHNVIKIKPPMVIQKSDIDYMLYCLRRVFQEDQMRR